MFFLDNIQKLLTKQFYHKNSSKLCWTYSRTNISNDLKQGYCIVVLSYKVYDMDSEIFPNQEPDGGVEIRCDNMDLCGDIVQALAVDYLGLDYLVTHSKSFKLQNKSYLR